VTQISLAELAVKGQSSGAQTKDTKLAALQSLKARISALPCHDGLLTYKKVVAADSNAYLLQHLMKHRSLRDFMAKHRFKYLREEEMVVGAQTITDALRALHDSGFAHGSIKLSNVVFSSRQKRPGFVTLALIKTHASRKVDDDNDVISRPAAQSLSERLYDFYSAPEVLRGGKPTQKSDIWSLGVAFFALATGRYPFASASQIRPCPPDFPRSPELSEEFKRLLTAMLDKNPCARPTARQVL